MAGSQIAGRGKFTFSVGTTHDELLIKEKIADAHVERRQARVKTAIVWQVGGSWQIVSAPEKRPPMAQKIRR